MLVMPSLAGGELFLLLFSLLLLMVVVMKLVVGLVLVAAVVVSAIDASNSTTAFRCAIVSLREENSDGREVIESLKLLSSSLSTSKL
jgi:hypothetical protein